MKKIIAKSAITIAIAAFFAIAAPLVFVLSYGVCAEIVHVGDTGDWIRHVQQWVGASVASIVTGPGLILGFAFLLPKIWGK